MEDKKLDLNSIIGFALIFAILIWVMYQNQPTEKEKLAEKVKTEKSALPAKISANAASPVIAADSIGDDLQIDKLKATLGNFAYSATLSSAKEDFTFLENKVVKLKIANKGGYIVEATLKNFEKFKRMQTPI